MCLIGCSCVCLFRGSCWVDFEWFVCLCVVRCFGFVVSVLCVLAWYAMLCVGLVSVVLVSFVCLRVCLSVCVSICLIDCVCLCVLVCLCV